MNKYETQIRTVASEKEQITYKGIPIRLTANISTETLEERKEWQNILKMMGKKKSHNQD